MARIIKRCRETVNDYITPTYITTPIIIKAVEAEKPTEGIAGEFAGYEEIVLRKVLSVRLDHLNIMKICNLEQLSNLTQLNLSNNKIEKIEHIDTLVHLKELDMSFNRIEMIENLDDLINLETLSLYSNKINQIENLNTLKKLVTFNIGKNLIQNRENIFYLRKFKKLRYLNMNGNECAKKTDFRLFVVTFLPQIAFYDYIHVTEIERIEGNDRFSKRLQDVRDDELVEVLLDKKAEAEAIEMNLHDASFMEFMTSSTFFDSLFEKDADGRMFLEADRVVRRYNIYKDEFIVQTKKFYAFGMQKYAERKNEIAKFLAAVEKAHQETYDKSQDAMERFSEKKARILKVGETLNDSAKSEPNADVVTLSEIYLVHLQYFNNIINETKMELIGLEMTLTERIQTLNSTFEKALAEHISDFIYDIKYYFADFKAIVEFYIEELEEIVKELAQSLLKEDHPYIPDELIPYLEDKSKAEVAFSNSYRVQTQLVRRRQNRMTNRAKKWLEKQIVNLQRDETVRNRQKIIEINHYLECSLDEYEERFNPLRPDVTAALDN
ncbi:TbCMF46 [Carabus blaptoides fortunei]